jgi:hypothetical protein
LRTLLRQCPDNGLLRRYLGYALWRQGCQDAARSEYAAALLFAPDKVDAEIIPVPGLRAIIMEQGSALAPIYGYFTGILPLAERLAVVLPEATFRSGNAQVLTPCFFKGSRA